MIKSPDMESDLIMDISSTSHHSFYMTFIIVLPIVSYCRNFPDKEKWTVAKDGKQSIFLVLFFSEVAVTLTQFPERRFQELY